MGEFINQTLSALTNPARGLSMYKKSKGGDFQLRVAQRELIGATKFTVSDSLLRHAVKAMFVRPEKILAACEMAIPPFENMWIEWDSHLQRDLMKQEYEARGVEYNNKPEGGLSRVAYHIVNVKDMMGYCMYGITDDDNKIHFPPFLFYLHNEGELPPEKFLQRRGNKLIDIISDDGFIEQQEHFGSFLFGKQYIDMWKEPKHLPHLRSLYRRTAFGVHTLGVAGDPDIPTLTEGDLRREGYIKGTLGMVSGDARLLITLLALVNYPHHIVERKLEQGVPRVMYGKRLPRNEVRVLEIDLPKPRGTTRYERMFTGSGTPKRQHVRRGHWRVYHHKDGTVTKRWIGEQIVGNAALGVIDHEYDLKCKGTK